jgi:uncharacterized membrane protein (UPF0127 family)
MKKLLTESHLRQFIHRSIVESAIKNPSRSISVANKRIQVEIADTEMSRNMGMIIFEDSAPRRFWMKNTYVPLSIAYIDSFGKIISISDMSPLSESGVWSGGPAMYALEMNKGWFSENGIVPGDLVKI